MANSLYRFINRATTYIGEVLALSYFNELFTTYNSALPLDTENQVAYFFPKEIVDDVGGVTDSALIGIANKNGEFQELSGIGVPNGGEIVNVTVGNDTFEAVLFSPVPQGAIRFNFANNSYSNKTAFYNYISPKVTGINSINDILNFSSAGAIVYFDSVNPLEIKDNAFENDNVLYAINDSSGAIQSVGSASFRNSNLISVIAPNCISVGNYAFKGCEILMTATLDSLQLAGIEAFYGCETVIIFSFPNCNTIGETAFAYCTGATTFSLPLIDDIPNSAFLSCSSCTSFAFNNVLTVGNSSFVNCSNVLSISLPLAVSAGNNAFEALATATSILIPNLTLAGDRCFYSCEGITSFSFPKLNSAGKECFMGCISCTSMDLFSVIGSPYIGLVDEFCFTDCVALETISLPYALTVNKNAFEGCTSLTSIALFGMNTLGDFAFKNCSSLTQVNISSIFSACGSTINNDGVFFGCTLSGLSIYINTTIQTDLDIVDAQAGGANIII